MEHQSPSGNGFLRFFGLETGEKARETILWALPYLLLMAAALVGLSLLVQWLWPVAGWVHAVAIGLALVYLFAFLARMRQMALEARTEPVDEDRPEP
ncbi:hypothetical protein [Deferrisoma sp.]